MILIFKSIGDFLERKADWLVLIGAAICISLSFYLHFNYDELYSKFYVKGYRYNQFIYDLSIDILVFFWGLGLYFLLRERNHIVATVCRYMFDIAIINIWFDSHTNPALYNLSKMENIIVIHSFFIVHTGHILFKKYKK